MQKSSPRKTTKPSKKRVKQSIPRRVPSGHKIQPGHPVHLWMESHKALVKAYGEKRAPPSGDIKTGWQLFPARVDAKSEISAPTEDALSSSVSMGRAMLDPNVRYEFRVVNIGVLSTNTSGTMISSIGVDPSAYGLSDWTALSSLFDEVRTIRSSLSGSPHLTSSGSKIPSCVVGYARSLTTSTTLVSYDSVAALPDSKLHTVTWSNPASHWTMSAAARNSLFAPIATPSGSVDVGCTGTWNVYLSSGDASTALTLYLLELFIELRARA